MSGWRTEKADDAQCPAHGSMDRRYFNDALVWIGCRVCGRTPMHSLKTHHLKPSNYGHHHDPNYTLPEPGESA